ATAGRHLDCGVSNLHGFGVSPQLFGLAERRVPFARHLLALFFGNALHGITKRLPAFELSLVFFGVTTRRKWTASDAAVLPGDVPLALLLLDGVRVTFRDGLPQLAFFSAENHAVFVAQFVRSAVRSAIHGNNVSPALAVEQMFAFAVLRLRLLGRVFRR